MHLRPVVTSVAVTTGLVAALGVGYAVGRDGGLSPDGQGPGRNQEPTPAASPFALANADPAAPADCTELVDSYVERALEVVGPWGWDGGGVYVELGDNVRGAAPAPQWSATRDTAKAPATSRVTNNGTGTNVQEAGVDEGDVVKTSGDLLVRLDERDLVVTDVSGDHPAEVGRLDLGDVRDFEQWADPGREMLLVGDRAVVSIPTEQGEATKVVTVDLSDPTAPEVADTLVVSDRVSAIRLNGDVVRAVVDSPRPDLDFVRPGKARTRKQATERNRQVVRESTAEDWLPTIDGALPECGDVAVPRDLDAPLGTTTVVAFDPTAPDELATTGVATSSSTTYMTPDRLYLASGSPSSGPWGPWGRSPIIQCWDCMPVDSGVTRLHAFALDGTATTYVASGEVAGSVRDRWSMDAVGDSLRVAVGPTSETGSFNSVVTLAEEGSELVEVGRVDKLGPGEDIKSVRWFDDLAIVVTFRQVDPLYATDLTDPAHPRLIGKLKIPGFSEYLHPLGTHRMIGMGQAPGMRGRSSAQAALFNVHDLTRPRQLDVVRYQPNTQARAGLDPRQFTWLPDHRTALTVVSRGWTGRTGWVSVLEVRDGRLHNRMVEVEHGTAVDGVRLVPLASGKVALVTGDGVSFFDLGA